MAALLAPEHGSSAFHLLEHVAVTDLRLDELDPGVAHAAHEPEVRHHGPDDHIPLERPALVHRQRARSQHLIAIDHGALGVGEQRTVRVAVMGDPRIGAAFGHLRGDDVGMQGSASDVDVAAVRLGVDRDDLGAQPAEDLGRHVRRRSVRAIHDDPHPVEPGLCRGLEVMEVPFPTLGDPRQRPACGPGGIDAREIRLDLVLQMIGELHPFAGEELDPVVGRRVMGRADHDPARCFQIDGHERDRRCRLDPREEDIAARVEDALREGVLEPRTGLAGVAADDERRRLRRAVAAEHGDRRATELVGQVAREVGAGHATNAVGAEEPSHQDGTLPEEVLCQRPNASVDLIADRSDRFHGKARGVRKVPVEVPLPGEDGTGVAASHRDDDIGGLDGLVGERLGELVGDVHVHLAHHLDDGRVELVGGRAPRGADHDPRPGVLRQQARGHL